jgi:hypothetical protein
MGSIRPCWRRPAWHPRWRRLPTPPRCPGESGGEPPGRWWGPGAKALGFEHGQTVERQPYDLLFGERKAPDGTPLGRPPGNGRKAADMYAALLAAEPHATAERRRELRIEAVKHARQTGI